MSETVSLSRCKPQGLRGPETSFDVLAWVIAFNEAITYISIIIYQLPTTFHVGLISFRAFLSEVLALLEREEYKGGLHKNCERNPGLDDIRRGLGSGNIRARCASNVRVEAQPKPEP